MGYLTVAWFALSYLAAAPAQPPREKALLVLATGGHTQAIVKLCFTPDSQRLVTVGADRAVRVWDVNTGEGRLLKADLSPDGQMLAVAGYGPGIGGQAHRSHYERLLLSVFVAGPAIHGKAGGEWVAWTPEGFYAASAGGENMMVWLVSEGPDAAHTTSRRSSNTA